MSNVFLTSPALEIDHSQEDMRDAIHLDKQNEEWKRGIIQNVEKNLLQEDYLITHAVHDVILLSREVSGVQCPPEISEYEYQLAYTAWKTGYQLAQVAAAVKATIGI